LNSKLIVPPGTQRVFIGVPVDRKSQLRINSLVKPHKISHPGIRWVAENNRHLTLAFLGNKPIDVVEKLLGLFDETYTGETQFQYKLSTLTRFPDPMGRIIALSNAPDVKLNNLYQLTVELLQRNGVRFDRKEFRPHITLGRIRHAKQLDTTFTKHTDINLNITKLTFFQSVLTESGVNYHPLKETQLNKKPR